MKKNSVFGKRPIKAATVLAAVLVLIMIPAAAFGIVYGYHAYQTEHGYAITADIAPVHLDAQTMEELAQYILRFDNETVNINDIGKRFDSYDALDAWLGGILLTSPMLDGESVIYCTDDTAGTPTAAHVSGISTVADTQKTCAISITIPFAALGEEFDWMTKGADMRSTQTVTAENGMEAEFVTTETSVTAYLMHSGILYRLNVAGNHEEAAAVLTEIIGTMK